jgi:hypothetical protein
MNSENAEQLRRKAEEIVARAHEDPDYAERLRTDPRAVLDENGVFENAVVVNLPMVIDCAQTCVDFTCIFTPSLCPDTCLPMGTVVMCAEGATVM